MWHMAVLAELEPDGMVWLRANGRWQLGLILAAYALVVLMTNRLYVTGPERRSAIRDLEEAWCRLDIAAATVGVDPSAVEAQRGLLRSGFKVLHRVPPGEKGRGVSGIVGSDFAQIATARRYLHSSLRVGLQASPSLHVATARLDWYVLTRQAPDWDDKERRTRAVAVAKLMFDCLERLDALGAQSVPVPGGVEDPSVASRRAELAMLVTESQRLIQSNDDERLSRNADAQTRTRWMVYLGIGVVAVAGMYGPRTPLLFGALGGFMAPVMQARRRRLDPTDYRTSWEVLLLGPVAGALAGYSGLLLAQFLASNQVNLLGPLFEQHAWHHPNTAVAKALAFLLGYSATLFTFLTAKAVAAVEAPRGDGADPGAAGQGGAPSNPPTPAPAAAAPAPAAGPVPAVAAAAVAAEAPTVGEQPLMDAASAGSTAATTGEAPLPEGFGAADLVASDVAPEGGTQDCTGEADDVADPGPAPEDVEEAPDHDH